ncbi:MAG: FKBP-type peptidyl-prolyl cis-trans isomerase [Holophaga sp.]|nr:FKBP-type peptidyl-prolyl cis-trans isomerase [Holophaga sp.]
MHSPLALPTALCCAFSSATVPPTTSKPTAPSAPADLTAPPSDAIKTPSGLATRCLQAGTGEKHAAAKDYVTLHYTGWTLDGKAFDSTLPREEPLILPLERLMKGMGEGVQLMVEGETRRMWIPEALAFGGAKGRPAGDLVLDVHLLSVDLPPTQAPADVTQPPADARLTSSGLVFRTLRKGTGTQHPTRRSQVYVHYTGWTLDGKMFDSSILRKESSGFRLDEVIRGWTEGIQLMVKGEKTRFWIPEKLAYRGERGKPAGMLVFDVELLSFWE